MIIDRTEARDDHGREWDVPRLRRLELDESEKLNFSRETTVSSGAGITVGPS